MTIPRRKTFSAGSRPKLARSVNSHASSHSRLKYFWLCSRCWSRTHAACPSFNRVLIRPLTCSGKGELTLRSNNPVFRSAQLRATPSGTPRIGSGSRTVTTVPSSLRRRVISDEQRWQSQKYSTRLDLDDQSVGSLSRRKNLPSFSRVGEHQKWHGSTAIIIKGVQSQ